MSTELLKFNQLQAEIAVFVEPVKTMTVVDFQSSEGALEVAKKLKSYGSQVEKTRKEITEPLDAKKKEIMAYEKAIMAPLNEALAHVMNQINSFAAKQEQIRQAELRRVEEERRKAEADLKARQHADRKASEEASAVSPGMASLFGLDPRLMTEEPAQTEERELIERAALTQEYNGRAWDAGQQQIKGARKTWKCKAIDLDKVPREFLTITLNESAVLAAARGGVTSIAGVQIWQEVGVAIGSKSYVPKQALR